MKTYKQFIQQKYLPGSTNIDSSISYQIKINSEGATELAQYLNWPIQKLNLSLYFIGDEGMQAIIKAGHKWPSLKQLRLQRNSITCEGFKGIVLADWKKLKKINLNKNNIKSKGFQYLIQADWPQLQQFEISHSVIGVNGGYKLSLTNWPNLKILNLNYNLITDEGVRSLTKCKLQNLEVLQISNNKLYSKSMFYLSQISLPNLLNLTVNRNFIGRDDIGLTELGCVYLTKLRVKHKGLEQLHIFGNDLTVNGIRQILYSDILAQNCHLQIIRNNFTFQQIENDIKVCKVFCNKF